MAPRIFYVEVKRGKYVPDVSVWLDKELGDFEQKKLKPGFYLITTENVSVAEKLCLEGEIQHGSFELKITEASSYSDLHEVQVDNGKSSLSTGECESEHFDFHSEPSLTGHSSLIESFEVKIYEWAMDISEIHVDIQQELDLTKKLSDSSILKMNEFFKDYQVDACDSHMSGNERQCLLLMFKNSDTSKKEVYDQICREMKINLLRKVISGMPNVIKCLDKKINNIVNKHDTIMVVINDREVVLQCKGDLDQLQWAAEDVEALLSSTKTSTFVIKSPLSQEQEETVIKRLNDQGILLKATRVCDDSEDKNVCAILGEIKVSLIYGDISNQQADVIVNSVHNLCHLRKGEISRAIFKKSGYKLQDAFLAKEVWAPGEVVVTDGFAFPCKKIFHICSRLMTHENDPLQYMGNLIASCLKLSNNDKFNSIAIPPVGFKIANGMKLNKSNLIKSYLNACEALVDNGQEKFTRDVRFVIRDWHLFEDFKIHMEDLITNEHNLWMNPKSLKVSLIVDGEDTSNVPSKLKQSIGVSFSSVI